MTKSFSPQIVKANTAAGKKLLAEIDKGRAGRAVEVEATAAKIIDEVRADGDAAIFRLAEKFDKVKLDKKRMKISHAQLEKAAKACPEDLKETIREAAKRIEKYHRAQHKPHAFSIKTDEGKLSQMVLPLERVGLYIPGGYTVYSSTVLMCAIPAKIAGVKEIVAVTPVRGEINSALAFVLLLLEIKEIYGIGGAQAIAALAYGTETIRPVDKIVGPGNAYVAAAKRQVFGRVDIDAVAGPSDVAVLCDKTANPTWVALDLLSQAEHGSGDETALCVTDSSDTAKAVAKAVADEIELSPVKHIFERLRENAITIVLAKDMAACAKVINDVGPEHLEIMTADPHAVLKSIRNAAAIFIGPYSPVPCGDYFVGTNHVLPTGGAARYASPLGVDSFLKRISVAEISKNGLAKSAKHISRFARAEGFVHHALSVERRVGL